MCPDAMIDLIYPFFLKCALRIQEPIESKRSRAVDLYKGAGKFFLMSHYRNILLSGYIIKPYQKFLRMRALEVLRSLLRASQAGGVPGGSCELPILVVRSFAKYCKANLLAGPPCSLT